MKSDQNRFHTFLMDIGSLMGCHQMPERSFFFVKYQFPVCARCTGVLAGIFTGIPLWVISRISLPVCIVFCLIMYVDWQIQDLGILKSNNIRRLVTGYMCGIGYIHLVAYGMNALLTWIRGF